MRCLARVGMALCGLALITPASVWAQLPQRPAATLEYSNPADLPQASKPKPKKKSKAKTKPKVAQAPAHKHEKDWLGREMVCPECQYNKLRAQGLNVPPPPRHASADEKALIAESDRQWKGKRPRGAEPEIILASEWNNNAPKPAAAAGTIVVEGAQGQVTPEMKSFLKQIPTHPGQFVIVNVKDIPGYSPSSGSSAPGIAVAGGTEPGAGPSPIGVATARRGFLARRSPTAAPADNAVMPSSIAPASDPIDPGGSGNPYVLSHLFGLAAFRRDIKDGLEAKQQRKRDKHAALSYDPATEKVQELPASMVYGR